MLLPFIKRQVPDGLWQSGITIGGNTLATGISAVALILLSRLMGPTRFGEFSIGFAIIMILNKLNDAGLNATLLKYIPPVFEDRAQVNRIFSYTARIKLLLALAILILGMVITPWLTTTLRFSQPQIIYLAFVLSFASTAYEQLLTLLQAFHRFTEAVLVNAMQAITKLIGVLLISLVSGSSNLVIFAMYMLAPVIPLLFWRRLLPNWIRLDLTQGSIPEKHQIMSMARHSAIGFVAAGLIENIDVLFIQRYLTTYETGLMAGVSRIATMVVLIAYSLGNVLYPRVARYQTQEHLQKYLQKSGLVMGMAVVGYIVVVPFAELAISLTIGKEYIGGTGVLNILLAAAFLTIATIPFLALFYSFKADWYFSISGLLQLAIVVIGNLLFVPTYGLEGSAWTRLFMRVFLFLFTVIAALWLYYRKFYGQPARQK